MELALILASLIVPPDGRCYHGANIDQYATGEISFEMKLRGFEQGVGKDIAIMGWFTFPRAQGRDTKWSGNQKRYLERCRDAGKIPLLSFTFSFLGERGWADFDEWLAGDWDDQLEQMAEVFHDFGGPILLAINSEMNGNWAPYSVDARSRNEEAELAGEHNAEPTRATTEGYIASWRYIHDFLRKRGCRNVAFCFVVSGGAYARPDVYTRHFREYFPGDEYVDWMGFDILTTLFRAHIGMQQQPVEFRSDEARVESSIPEGETRIFLSHLLQAIGTIHIMVEVGNVCNGETYFDGFGVVQWFLPQHFLYFLPLPHGHGSFLPISGVSFLTVW